MSFDWHIDKLHKWGVKDLVEEYWKLDEVWENWHKAKEMRDKIRLKSTEIKEGQKELEVLISLLDKKVYDTHYECWSILTKFDRWEYLEKVKTEDLVSYKEYIIDQILEKLKDEPIDEMIRFYYANNKENNYV